jgi:hypothetical protein
MNINNLVYILTQHFPIFIPWHASILLYLLYFI